MSKGCKWSFSQTTACFLILCHLSYFPTFSRNNFQAANSDELRNANTSQRVQIPRAKFAKLTNVGSSSFISHGFCPETVEKGVIGGTQLLYLLQILDNKTLTLVGDSLSQQMFDALLIHANIFGMSVDVSYTLYRSDSTEDKCYEKIPMNTSHAIDWSKREDLCNGVRCSAYKSFSAILEGMDKIVKINLLNVYRVKMSSQYYYRTCGFCHIEELITTSDYVIINFGLHYSENVVANAAREEYEPLLLLIKSLMAKSEKVYYRLTLPQHFNTSTNAYNSSKQNISRCVKHGNRIDLNEVERLNLAKFADRKSDGGNLLDLYSVFEMAGNLHSVGNWRDCTHFCWSDILFEPVWASLHSAFSKAE